MRCLTIRWRTNVSRLCSCSCRKHDRWGWPNGPIYLTPLLLFTFFSALPHSFTSQTPFLYISSPVLFFISIWLLFCVIAFLLHHNTFSFSPPFPLILPLFPSHSSPLFLLFFFVWQPLFIFFFTVLLLSVWCENILMVE